MASDKAINTVEEKKVEGKLVVTVKMSRLPKSHKKLENYYCEFTIDMQPMKLVIRTPQRMFSKLFRAINEALEWVATIDGKVSELTENQIIVDEAKIFVVNKVLKPSSYFEAQSIAKQLLEKEHRAVLLIQDIVEFIGVEESHLLVKRAKEIYEGEGLWYKEGEEEEPKKRSLGGIFFFLAKEKIPREDWLKKWSKRKRRELKRKKKELSKEQEENKDNMATEVTDSSLQDV